jgi:cold shock CspA family protein
VTNTCGALAVKMSMTGKIVEFSASSECGFIQPDDGTARVFLHADDVSPPWLPLDPGTAVRFCSVPGMRGLRAYNVVVLQANPLDPPTEADGRRSYDEEIMAVLVAKAPSITAAEITEVREQLALLAAHHGWLQ